MKKILVPALLLVVGLLAGLLIGRSDIKLPVGSVTVGNEYQYSQFSGEIATTTLIKLGSSVLGSVIITEDSATAVTFWDATSSAAVTDGTYATKVAVMQAALTEGVYTFDVQLNRGLVMRSTDGFTFAGDWTVTYR